MCIQMLLSRGIFLWGFRPPSQLSMHQNKVSNSKTSTKRTRKLIPPEPLAIFTNFQPERTSGRPASSTYLLKTHACKKMQIGSKTDVFCCVRCSAWEYATEQARPWRWADWVSGRDVVTKNVHRIMPDLDAGFLFFLFSDTEKQCRPVVRTALYTNADASTP